MPFSALSSESTNDCSYKCKSSLYHIYLVYIFQELETFSYYNVLWRMFAGGNPHHVLPRLSFHISSTDSNKQDFYQILGVPRTASQKEIKKAYYQVRLQISVHYICSMGVIYHRQNHEGNR